jgi:hypothetical protein
MIGVTLFGLFLTPVFFYVIRRFAGQRTPAPADSQDLAVQANPPIQGAAALEMSHG